MALIRGAPGNFYYASGVEIKPNWIAFSSSLVLDYDLRASRKGISQALSADNMLSGNLAQN